MIRDSYFPVNTFHKPTIVPVFHTDRPTPPVGPVLFEEVHREYMIISWKPPLDSGGVDISNYIIEKRDTNRDMWTTVTSATTKTSCKVGVLPRSILLLWYHRFVENQVCVVCRIQLIWAYFPFQIPKLTEGREYIMRISAENMYGISDPLESEEMRAKDLFSMFCIHTYFTK